ncbi:hypothetical protein NL478_27385, partial [Klebsiella pneumoniae]|nr:hypothetical protein [Klebsiella pneumoniae]
TRLAAFSPLSETMFSAAKPPVAVLSSANENSANAGTSPPPLLPGGAAWCAFKDKDGRCGGGGGGQARAGLSATE